MVDASDMKDFLSAAFAHSQNLISDFVNDKSNLATMEDIIEVMAKTLVAKQKIITCGNGGSMCDAMHFAEELSGRFRKDRPALPAMAICDPSHITCVGNDYGFDQIFARGVEAYANADDVVMGFSTSGNSPNIINALAKAQEIGCFTVAMLGGNGGKLKGACDYELIVPAYTSDRIQEIHGIIIHLLIEGIERKLFADLYQ